MTAALFDVTSADDATFTPGGPQLYTGGWAARIVPTGPVPTHVKDCLLGQLGFPAEVCACNAGTEWLRTRHEHQQAHAA